MTPPRPFSTALTAPSMPPNVRDGIAACCVELRCVASQEPAGPVPPSGPRLRRPAREGRKSGRLLIALRAGPGSDWGFSTRHPVARKRPAIPGRPPSGLIQPKPSPALPAPRVALAPPALPCVEVDWGERASTVGAPRVLVVGATVFIQAAASAAVGPLPRDRR